MRRIFPFLIVLLLFFFVFVLKLDSLRGLSAKSNVLMTIKMPTPTYRSKTSIEEAINQRRSIREYKNEPLELHEVGQLLWAAQGITSKEGFRAAPSAGALYPLEIYLIVGNVKNLDSGVYHYLPQNHSLEKIDEGDKRNVLYSSALSQESVRNSAMDIVIAADYGRTVKKYGRRGHRFVILEAGHAAENVCLQAVSLKLGIVTIGAFDDSAVHDILKFKKLEPIYILPVGKI